MKFNLKSLFAGVVIGSVIATSGTALAYNGTRSIQAAFKNIRIYIDGAELTPRDSAGNVLEPFIYNGSTYLPIRAVGEAVGKNVSFDANSNSVYLSSDGGGNVVTPSQGTKLEPYQLDDCLIKDIISMGGVKYKNGIYTSSYYNIISKVYYNLNGTYGSVNGVYGSIDDRNTGDSEGTVSFYGDGILLKSYTVTNGQLPKNFTINTAGVSQFCIEFEAEDTFYFGIGDITFK